MRIGLRNVSVVLDSTSKVNAYVCGSYSHSSVLTNSVAIRQTKGTRFAILTGYQGLSIAVVYNAGWLYTEQTSGHFFRPFISTLRKARA